MSKIYDQAQNTLKRKKEPSIREDDFFGLFNGESYKKKHQNTEENYNICNKSLEYLPSFHMEANERSIHQMPGNEHIFNEYFIFNNSNKINYKIEEFLEIGSDDCLEDSFLKDFPQENFTDIFLYWEYEEDDLNLVREIFYLNEWAQKDNNMNKLFAYNSKTSNIRENVKKTPDFKNFNLQISDVDVRYFLMGQIFKMMNEEHPIIKIT